MEMVIDERENSRGSFEGRNVNANFVIEEESRLRIEAWPRVESNVADTVVPLVVTVMLAWALDVDEANRYKAEPSRD
jgi:hypothetical protein